MQAKILSKRNMYSVYNYREKFLEISSKKDTVNVMNNITNDTFTENMQQFHRVVCLSFVLTCYWKY